MQETTFRVESVAIGSSNHTPGKLAKRTISVIFIIFPYTSPLVVTSCNMLHDRYVKLYMVDSSQNINWWMRGTFIESEQHRCQFGASKSPFTRKKCSSIAKFFIFLLNVSKLIVITKKFAKRMLIKSSSSLFYHCNIKYLEMAYNWQCFHDENIQVVTTNNHVQVVLQLGCLE